MNTQEIIKLSTLAERLGWQPKILKGGEPAGVHVVDLLVSRAFSDLIAALAQNRDR